MDTLIFFSLLSSFHVLILFLSFIKYHLNVFETGKVKVIYNCIEVLRVSLGLCGGNFATAAYIKGIERVPDVGETPSYIPVTKHSNTRSSLTTLPHRSCKDTQNQLNLPHGK